MKTWMTISLAGIEVPYRSGPRDRGQPKSPYLDLKRNPNEIWNIPELQAIPELRQFVSYLNAANNIFRTVGSGYKITLSTSQERKQVIMDSHVRICYDMLNWNRGKDNFVGLYKSFEWFATARGALLDRTSVEFEIHPATYAQHQVEGCALTIRNAGRGDADAEAQKNWSKGLEIVREFLETQRALYADVGREQMRVS